MRIDLTETRRLGSDDGYPKSSAPDLDIGGCSTELIDGARPITTLLMARADIAEKQRLVRIRQAYLEELDRRDPNWAAAALDGPEEPAYAEFDRG